MVGESGTSVLLVSVNPDSTYYCALFYGAAVDYSKRLHCPVTFWMLLPANDTIEKLR